jgi:hypothetical protein
MVTKKTTKTKKKKEESKSSAQSTSTVIKKPVKAEVTTLGPAPEVKSGQVAPVQEVTGQTIDAAQQAEFRARQMALADQLAAQSRGEGPSQAGLQLQRALEDNQNAQLSFARSNRNVNPALAMKQAQGQMASLGQRSALDAAQARIAEIQSAQGLLGGVVDAGRVQDIGLATSQAQLLQQAALANQEEANKAAIAQGLYDTQANVATGENATKYGITQGGFDQGVSSDYAAALNAAATRQAEINAQIKQAQMSADATRSAASSGANASRYATDAGLYKFNMENALNLDQAAYLNEMNNQAAQNGANATGTGFRNQNNAAATGAAGNLANAWGFQGSKTNKMRFQ